MEELNNFDQISFAAGMFTHQLISGPLFGLALFMLVSAFFKNEYLERFIRERLLPVYVIIFSLALISGLSLDLGLDYYWKESLVKELSDFKYGRSSILGFLIVNFTLIFIYVKPKNRITPLLSLFLCLGSFLLFFWSFVINSIMQNPALINLASMNSPWEVKLVDIFANPYFALRLVHYLNASFLQGVLLVLLTALIGLELKNESFTKSKFTLKLMLICVCFTLFTQFVSGHLSMQQLATVQPTKAAAAIGLYTDEQNMDVFIMAYTDSATQENYGLRLPTFLAKRLTKNTQLPALDTYANEDLPKIALVFQSFHLMVFSWFLLVIALLIIAIRLIKYGKVPKPGVVLALLLISIITTQTGWILSETGRKPWLFYGLERYSMSANPPIWRLFFNNIILQLAILLLGGLMLYRKMNSVDESEV